MSAMDTGQRGQVQQWDGEGTSRPQSRQKVSWPGDETSPPQSLDEGKIE
jgi:hypothetical protein